MTRINLVNVKDLADQHLFIEWNEIKRVPELVRKWHFYDVPSLPQTYRMGTGHVIFFYNKLEFLYFRYLELTEELHTRNYKISNTNAVEIFLKDIPDWSKNMTVWKPSKEEIKVNIERLFEKLYKRPEWYRHYGKVQSPEFFIDMNNQQLLVDACKRDPG